MNLSPAQSVPIVAAIARGGIRTHKASQPLGPKPSAFTGFATRARGNNRGWHESNRWRPSATRPLTGTLAPIFSPPITVFPSLIDWTTSWQKNAHAQKNALVNRLALPPKPSHLRANGRTTSNEHSPRNAPLRVGPRTKTPSNKKARCRGETVLPGVRGPALFVVAATSVFLLGANKHTSPLDTDCFPFVRCHSRQFGVRVGSKGSLR